MKYVLFTDGGSRGNPGKAAAGWAIMKVTNDELQMTKRDGDEIIKTGAKYLGIKTNNFAEYSAILEGLKDAVELNIKNLEVCMDSELAVKQINGIYKVKDANIKEFIKEIVELKKKFKDICFVHVYRENNKLADKLVNECLDGQS